MFGTFKGQFLFYFFILLKLSIYYLQKLYFPEVREFWKTHCKIKIQIEPESLGSL